MVDTVLPSRDARLVFCGDELGLPPASIDPPALSQFTGLPAEDLKIGGYGLWMGTASLERCLMLIVMTGTEDHHPLLETASASI